MREKGDDVALRDSRALGEPVVLARERDKEATALQRRHDPVPEHDTPQEGKISNASFL